MAPPTSRQRASVKVWESLEGLERTLREFGSALDASDIEAVERLLAGVFRGLKEKLPKGHEPEDDGLCSCGNPKCAFNVLGGDHRVLVRFPSGEEPR